MRSTRFGYAIATAVAGVLAVTMSSASAREPATRPIASFNDGASAPQSRVDPQGSAARLDAAEQKAALINRLADKFQSEAGSMFKGEFSALEWRLVFGTRLFHQDSDALTSALQAADLNGMHANVERAAAAKNAGNPNNIITLLNTPCRIVDTRLGGGGVLGTTPRLWYASNTAGIIAGQGGSAAGCGTYPNAEFFLVYVTVVPPGAPLSGGANFLTLQRDGTVPTTATMNYYPGINLANFATPACNGCAGSTVGGFFGYASSNTHVVIDLIGVGQPSTAPAGRAYALVTTAVTFDATRTKGFTAVSRPSTGIYCLTPSAGIDANTSPAFLSVEWSGSLGNLLAAYHRSCATCAGCAAGDFAVRTQDFAGTLTDNVSFEIFVP